MQMARRVAYLGEELWLLGYSRPPDRYVNGDHFGGQGRVAFDSSLRADREALIRVEVGGRIVITRAGQSLDESRLVAARSGALAVALAQDDSVYIAGPMKRVERMVAGKTDWTFEIEDAQRIQDVAVSPDGRFVALPDISGDIFVYSPEGTRLGHLRGHSKRCVRVVFSPDSLTLYSASWDGTLRSWQMGPLLTPRDQFGESLWGLTLDEALAGI